MDFKTVNLKWTREPLRYTVKDDVIEIVTEPHTDLWQRTYYNFRNDNAPLLQMTTDERYFTFEVMTEFDSKHRFDQCGVILYQDSENWLKASVEYENENFQRLGSVVTNAGYSDWATMDIDPFIRSVWYRLSRRESDYCLEYSLDGKAYKQMRICHLHKGAGTICFGVYACSPEDSSFKAIFRNFCLKECLWAAHDGQPPDKE